MVIIDTSVIIDHLRQYPKTDTLLTRFIEGSNEKTAISLITIQELYRGKSTKRRSIEQYLIDTLDIFELLPYTQEIARLGGEIVRDLKDPIEFGDAAIAATALINESSLLTLNKKDFEMIKRLDLV